MGALKDRLQADLTAAMKAQDELVRATLRMALTAIGNEEVAGKAARALSDDEELAVVTREAKKRREAAEAFRSGGATDRAERELAEEGVLAALPAAAARRRRAARRWWPTPSRRPVPRPAADGRRHEGRCGRRPPAGSRAAGWPPP